MPLPTLANNLIYIHSTSNYQINSHLLMPDVKMQMIYRFLFSIKKIATTKQARIRISIYRATQDY